MSQEPYHSATVHGFYGEMAKDICLLIVSQVGLALPFIEESIRYSSLLSPE